MRPPVRRSTASVTSIEDLDDATLAARAPHEPELFAVLFRRYVRDIHGFVRRRTGDDALADDLTATTFERCWDALGSFEPRRTTLRPWLFRIAANTVASHYRADGRRRRREHLVAVRDEPRRSDADPFADDRVLAVLGRLGERHQQVLSLRYLADLSTAEVAEAMQLTRGHVAVLQHRALAALRQELAGMGEVDR